MPENVSPSEPPQPAGPVGPDDEEQIIRELRSILKAYQINAELVDNRPQAINIQPKRCWFYSP